MPPLSGLKVVDLTRVLAGPFCAMLLGDMGADVIKVEEPRDGDDARGWAPFVGSWSSYFLGVNRSKRSLALDLKQPAGRELFFALLDRADVVLENLRVGTVQKLGIDDARCRARNSRVVYASISGFGQDGPYRDRAALDLVVQAESGMISITGPAEGAGVRCGISIADITAGMFAAFGIMTALHARETTGRGQFLDVSMLDGQLSILSGVIGTYLADGEVPRPMGTAYKALLPYQTFRTRTRDLAVGVGSDRLWQLFCPAIGAPELAGDSRFATNAARAANRTALVDALQMVFLTRTYEEWEAILIEAGVPVGAINTIADVVAHPQVRARQALVDTVHPDAGPLRVVAPPVRLSETPGSVRLPAPRLGEHTRAILGTLGVSAAEMTRLQSAGVIKCGDRREGEDA
jgi:crotonobetainyl-CoA:carnitine CoA-transferase CaiB-like acyl-CoA transferase